MRSTPLKNTLVWTVRVTSRCDEYKYGDFRRTTKSAVLRTRNECASVADLRVGGGVWGGGLDSSRAAIYALEMYRIGTLNNRFRFFNKIV